MTHASESSTPATKTPESFWEIVGRWSMSVDHKKLGMMYVGAGLIFFLVGGLEAAFMRLQLAQANLKIIDPETGKTLPPLQQPGRQP